MKVRWVLEAVGATLLLLFPVLEPLVTPGYRFIYHHHLPLTRLMGGLMLDFVVIAVAGVVVLAVMQRLAATPRRIIGGSLAGMFLWCLAYCGYVLLINGWGPVMGPGVRQPVLFSVLESWWHRWAFRLVVAVPLLVAVLAWLWPKIARPIVGATRVALAMVAFCGLWIVPEMVHVDLQAHEALPVVAAHAEARPARKTRIVWILFDELSYKLALIDPPPGQQFPNLERLHGESISFGNVQPVGNYTDMIIPSLMARRQIKQIRSTAQGQLVYLDEARHEWVGYDASRTLFATAQSDGWNPGVVGWAIPYCRIFAGLLTRCYWQQGVGAGLSYELWVKNDDSVLSYAWAVPRAFLAEAHSSRQADAKRLEGAIDDDRSLMEQMQATLEDERIHFVYLHLPVPHPPGVYNRRTHAWCACGNYLDNLTLADDLLGKLLKEIDATSGGDPTAVIVSSDHSWRVPLWQHTPYWSAEEERVSQGRFDPRPVFMIHFAGQRSGSEVLKPLSEFVEYDILSGMLEGKIAGPDDVEALVRQPVLSFSGQGVPPSPLGSGR
ncbi:MAG: sulfatase-like hydrolase/transferase [Acidobacteriaceae bacterium]